MDEQETRDLQPEEAGMLGRLQEELRRMTVGEHLATMLQSLAALAIRKMGMTSETSSERDLEQAKLAIEAFRALLPVVEPSRPQAEMQAHRGMLSDLQMAYVAALEPPAEQDNQEG